MVLNPLSSPSSSLIPSLRPSALLFFQTFNYNLTALASGMPKKNSILQPKNLLYLFYHLILQLIQYFSFYFSMQLNKII